jgi:hypothetical protein
MDPNTTFRPEFDDVALSRPGGLSFPSRSRRACDPRLDITHLLERIEPETVRGSVCTIFSSLLRLLDNLSVLAMLKEEPLAEETKIALRHYRSDADTLVDLMLETATKTEAVGDVLAQTLDGISFALSHDVKKSFESELKVLTLAPAENPGKETIAYVRELLTNCLQQSIITLAQVFDPDLDGARLFDNFQARLRESLILCRDLEEMRQAIRACKKNVGQYFPRVVERVERFRRESMLYLMYRDWQEFEVLSATLLSSVPENIEPGSTLHSFECYVETLLAQVKLRGVLVDVVCDFFPDGEETDPEWGDAQNRLAFELYRAELATIGGRSSGQTSPRQYK